MARRLGLRSYICSASASAPIQEIQSIQHSVRPYFGLSHDYWLLYMPLPSLCVRTSTSMQLCVPS